VLIDTLLEKSQVLISSAEGYEGDDVIGTYAHQALEHNVEVTIVTGDRDMLQLVSDKVKILMTVTGITKTVLYDETAVEEKYGVTPAQFVDYKALIGDPSDGYPGINGIGPKTAASLLQKFGTFENIYHHLGDVTERVSLQLATDAEQGALAKKLARIMTDAPVHLDLEKSKVTDIDFVKMKEEFVDHNFKSLVTRLEAKFPEVKKVTSKKSVDENQLGLL
jgi:DNA polymerase-1